ncbi:MAG TPA: cysteine desulfurase [Dongiaceae bacterium]|nr:cysteine desulfurase [Dongiaceae bacterium]
MNEALKPSPVSAANLEPLVDPDAFPLLAGARAAGHPLAYLDSAASAQKPAVVLDRLRDFYTRDYANIHRGVYPLSERSTEAYEGARERVARFLNAEAGEIVFTRGATEAINLVAYSFGERFLKPGNRILVSTLEHHANIVPWQMLRDRRDLKLDVIPIDGNGDIDMPAFARMVDGAALVCVTAVANTLGTVTPLEEIIALARRAGARVMVDGAQGAPHLALDVKALGCDFLAFTGHKVYGPDGIGVLYGKEELLAEMPPWQTGGDMIRTVTFERTLFAEPPRRFEAGTPPIGAAIGLATALDFIEGIGFERIGAHDRALADYAVGRLGEIPGLKLIGTPKRRSGIVSFVLDGVHPHDIGTLLGAEGVCVRTGHHCAQPLMEQLGITGTVRASFAVHSHAGEIDRLAEALTKARQILG